MILVTGGAGFIGRELCAEINRVHPSEKILVSDHLGSKDGKWKNLLGIQFHDYIPADELFASRTTAAAVKQIYHLGACADTTESDVDFLMRNNYHFSQKIFKWATERRIGLLYASSAATYGAGELGYSDDHGVVPSLRPLNPYGFSKQIFDQWVLSMCSKKKTPPRWYGIKFFNVYGPGEYHKGNMASVIFKASNKIKSSGKMQLFKSHRQDFKHGEQLRDFIYVKDVVRALLGMMDSRAPIPPTPSGIYNLGTGQARSFNDLVKGVFTAMSMAPDIEYVDMPEEIRFQYQYFTQAKMDKFTSCFPDFKFTSLEEGISDYVKNYLVTG